MKNLQRLFASVALAFAFTLHAFAGVMDFPKTEPPPPSTSASATIQGEMSFPIAPPDAAGGESAADSVTAIALNLAQTVLALF